jgi:hypothetical protein
MSRLLVVLLVASFALSAFSAPGASDGLPKNRKMLNVGFSGEQAILIRL